jgi:hypothetical protein
VDVGEGVASLGCELIKLGPSNQSKLDPLPVPLPLPLLLPLPLPPPLPIVIIVSVCGAGVTDSLPAFPFTLATLGPLEPRPLVGLIAVVVACSVVDVGWLFTAWFESTSTSSEQPNLSLRSKTFCQPSITLANSMSANAKIRRIHPLNLLIGYKFFYLLLLYLFLYFFYKISVN